MSPTQTQVTPDVLALDAERATAEIVERLREIVGRELKRKGAVVGVSGGIDSSVTAGLCARAFGPDRTLALLMPEADSDPDTLELSRSVADAFDIPTVVEDITPILEATRCYERRDEAVRSVIPEFGEATRPGVAISGVRPASPAEKAGLKAGDVILRFAGVDVKTLEDLTFALRSKRAGDRVGVTIVREGRTRELEATLEERR